MNKWIFIVFILPLVKVGFNRHRHLYDVSQRSACLSALRYMDKLISGLKRVTCTVSFECSFAMVLLAPDRRSACSLRSLSLCLVYSFLFIFLNSVLSKLNIHTHSARDIYGS